MLKCFNFFFYWKNFENIIYKLYKKSTETTKKALYFIKMNNKNSNSENIN